MNWGRFSAGIVLAISFILGGCTATSLKPETTKNAHTVGIISAVGDDLSYRNVPFFRWGQEEYHRDVSAWAIDQYVTEELSRALQPKYSVVPVEFDRAAFLDKKLYSKVSTGNAFPDAGPIGEIVRAHVRDPKADLYLVVLAGNQPVGLTATMAEAMGVLRYPAFGTDRYFVHAIYRIAIVDGHTFEPLAVQDAVNKEKYPLDGIIHGSPYEELEAEHWAEENEQVTLAQVEWIKDRIKALFARTLPTTLLRLNVLAP